MRTAAVRLSLVPSDLTRARHVPVVVTRAIVLVATLGAARTQAAAQPVSGSAVPPVTAAPPRQPLADQPRARQPLTCADAVALALSQGTTAAVGRADTAAANAQYVIARARPNPTLSASYTGAAPQLHAVLDVPVDLPSIRRLRVGSAQATLAA
ncbi:MAG: hypothetical protein M3154_01950, partial [Candidatus Eremiobacteraeota bacterium]|nr:hypothetical protein [Candidatus Eremiobacteraeota bacterium]